ncbi:MAG: hydroxyethylthiazole kinase [Candidatus Aminicenantales bacterium]
MMDSKSVWEDVQRIRTGAPLVHNITNYVVMNTTANALLSIGASPVMAHAVEEVEEMVAIAHALVINIGTLSAPWIASMLKAARAARERGIPVVLDPVGAGATSLRTATALRLLKEAPPAVIRGNASEIRALCYAEGETKGVDSRHEAEAALEAAQKLSSQFNCTVSVSGPVDLILHKESLFRVANGHPLMPRVTGLGCTASALTGAFVAVNPSSFQGAAHAMAVMGIAGEMAAERSAGPASFQMNFLDALYSLTEEDIRKRLKVESS